MSAASVQLLQPILIDPAHLRFLFLQPDGRRSCGCSQHYRNTGIPKLSHYPMQPGEIIQALFRLHFMPGKFRHPDTFQAGLFHISDIRVLFCLIPILRIISSTQYRSGKIFFRFRIHMLHSLFFLKYKAIL